MRKIVVIASIILVVTNLLPAQTASSLSPEVRAFVSVDAPVIALTDVRVIDGTGVPPVEDQTIVVEHGRIQAVGSAANTPVPAGAKVINLHTYTVVPGLVGMHDHLFYPIHFAKSRLPGAVPLYNEAGFSFPRLYLACGVTSIRTGGSIEPYTDLNLKKLIDEGKLPGPKMHITGPYLEGLGGLHTPNARTHRAGGCAQDGQLLG